MHSQSLYFIFLTYMELMGWPVNSLTNKLWEDGSFRFHRGFLLNLSSPYIKEKSSTRGRQAGDGVGETPHWPPWSCCTPHCLPHPLPMLIKHLYRNPLRTHLWWTPTWDHYSSPCISLIVLLGETSTCNGYKYVCVRVYLCAWSNIRTHFAS